MRTKPLYTLAVTWVLLIPLLVFASGGGFSFETASVNTAFGSVGVGLTASSHSESRVLFIQACGIYLICGLLAMRGLRAIMRGFRKDVLLSTFVALAFGSVFWSQNPGATIWASAFFTVNVAFAFYLLWRFSANDVMKLMMFVGTIAAAVSLILIFFFPQYGTQLRGSYAHGAWQGIWGQKNLCAAALTCLLIPGCFVKLSGRYSWVFRLSYFLTLFCIIALTRSVGGWVMCFCTMCSVLLFLPLRRASGKDRAAFVLIIVAIAASLAFLAFLNLEPLLALFGKDPTLTGRTVLWHYLSLSILKRPLTGFGYMAFWQGLQGESGNIRTWLNWSGLSYAENGIIELWLGLGSIGVVLFLALFARAIRDGLYCFRRTATPATMFYISILLFTVFENIEAGKVMYPSYLQCILQYVAFIGLRQERRQLEEQALDTLIAA
jgi:exopolysaccharide production protein ExoQ